MSSEEHTNGRSPASLTVQTAISLLSPQQLDDIVREVEKHKYYYLLVAESMEILNKYDLRHLKSFYAHSAEEVLELLSKDDRLIKLMCGDDHFKGVFYTYAKIDPQGVAETSFNGFSLLADVKNTKEIAAYVRENLVHSILLERIADFTYGDIYLYDNEFKLLRVNGSTNDGYSIVSTNDNSTLYSYSI